MQTNTPSLYSKILSAPEKLRWKDIFQSSGKKHAEADVDYAMIAGTTLDTAKTEIGMLQKWQQPWLYLRVLTAGALLSALTLAAVAVVVFTQGVCLYPALNLLLIVVPPCIAPVALMVLFWEMNVPRDISLTRLLSYFFIGGVLSLTITLVLGLFFPMVHAAYAPITEEPAKLMASLFLLKQLHKKNGKVYGFSGLAVGAAVGAGFAAFESAQYAFHQLPAVPIDLGGSMVYNANVMLVSMDTLLPVLDNILLRNLCAICTHVLYCAPYACLAALNMKDSGKVGPALSDKAIWIVFGISFLCHGLWNLVGGYLFLISLVLATVILWSTTLYGVRKSFTQIAEKVAVANHASAVTTNLRLQGIGGVHAGVAFTVTKAEVLIGSDASCNLNYPVSLTDIEAVHGKLLVRDGNLYLADLGSRSGTYLNGTRLKAMTGYLLKPGDRFSIGTSGQDFRVI